MEIIQKTYQNQYNTYNLSNSNGCSLTLSSYGATIVNILFPDYKGNQESIVLGFDNIDEYCTDHPYFGCTVGRFANRIAKGKFYINDKAYHLATNNGPNHLHGGKKGLSRALWKGRSDISKEDDISGISFYYQSPDGEDGYPGDLDVEVIYSLNEQNQIRIEYIAKTNKHTYINLTNHTYWNLNGIKSNILNHELTINSDKYLKTDENLIPTGEIIALPSELDFTKSKNIGKDIDRVSGYDHCYVLNNNSSLQFAAKVFDPQSKRCLELYTTEPGMQFYTGNFLDGSFGKKGCLYQKYYGLCLETQHFPDSPNKPQFPSTLLKPGEIFHSISIYQLSIK